MRLRDEIISGYNDLDPRVINYLDKVISDVNLNKSNTTEYTKIILGMLVIQLVLYYKAADEMMESNKVTSKDNYNRFAKSPVISVFNKANDQILILLDKIGLSPMQKAKIKKLNSSDEADAKELLDDLMS